MDDDEFHLPAVSELPTLESILNESDDDHESISDNENSLAPPLHPKVKQFIYILKYILIRKYYTYIY